MADIFDKQKHQCLQGVDFSRKGSVDAPIADLVKDINSRDNYFTTSSCSGRIAVVENVFNGKLIKSGCKWLFMSHTTVGAEELVESLTKLEGDASLKFEPFVLHVQCRSLTDAQSLLANAVGSGFRNSGISLGNKGKIIVAVRSTHGLEIPLSSKGELLVSQQYIHFCVELANTKMEENLNRIERFKDLYVSTIEKLKEKICKKKTISKKTENIKQEVYKTKDAKNMPQSVEWTGGIDLEDSDLSCLFPS